MPREHEELAPGLDIPYSQGPIRRPGDSILCVLTQRDAQHLSIMTGQRAENLAIETGDSERAVPRAREDAGAVWHQHTTRDLSSMRLPGPEEIPGREIPSSNNVRRPGEDGGVRVLKDQEACYGAAMLLHSAAVQRQRCPLERTLDTESGSLGDPELFGDPLRSQAFRGPEPVIKQSRQLFGCPSQSILLAEHKPQNVPDPAPPLIILRIGSLQPILEIAQRVLDTDPLALGGQKLRAAAELASALSIASGEQVVDPVAELVWQPTFQRRMERRCALAMGPGQRFLPEARDDKSPNGIVEQGV